MSASTETSIELSLAAQSRSQAAHVGQIAVDSMPPRRLLLSRGRRILQRLRKFSRVQVREEPHNGGKLCWLYLSGPEA